MTYWLTSFCVGVLASKFTDIGFIYCRYIAIGFIFLWLAFLVFRSLVKFNSNLYFVTLSSVVGFMWGFSHAAPNAHFAAQNVEILLSKANQDMYGVNFVKTGDGRVYEVKGYYSNAPYGTIKCFDSRSMLSSSSCFLKSAKYNPDSNTNLAQTLNKHLEKRVEHNLSGFSDDVKGLIYSILFGNKSFLDKEIKNDFRQTGTYHLLVVSGIHFTIIAGILCFFILLPFKLAYVFRLINPKTWINIALVIKTVLVVLLMFYAYSTGLSQATQRAFLIFVVHILSPILIAHLNLRQRILLVLSLQTIIFPDGIFCEATIMSWSAYLMFVDLSLTKSGRVAGFLKFLFVQIKLTFVVACCFGQAVPVGIVANPILVPLFPIVLGAAGFSAVFGAFNMFARKIALYILQLFLDLVGIFQRSSENYALQLLSGLFPSTESIGGEIFYLIISSVFILNCISRISSPTTYLKLKK